MTDEEGIDHWRLVKIVIVLAIGIPILLEATTFLGLVSHSLVGDDDPGDPTPSPMDDAVGIGDDVLPETATEERLTTASIGQDGDGWQFVATVQVTNSGETPYELRLGAVETTEGTVVDGDAGTGRIQPGETSHVTGSWNLPEGERPRTIDVSAVIYGDDGPRYHNETVRLKPVAVSG